MYAIANELSAVEISNFSKNVARILNKNKNSVPVYGQIPVWHK